MKARQNAIANLKKFLAMSEAKRLAPKESQEPKAEEAKEEGMAPEALEALQSLMQEG